MGRLDWDVGAKIRAFRLRKKVSLNELSRMTGIAASNLSSMELGKSSPTLNTLVKISDAFGIKAGIFLDEVLYRKAILCRQSDGEVSKLASGSQSISMTCGVWLNKLGVEFLEIGKGERILFASYHGDRFLYCLQGMLAAQVEDEVYVLRQGDGLYMMPDSEMNLGNEAAGNSSALFVRLNDHKS
jgi:transcriptional regulator with XRE-family HTH domain